MFKYYVLGAENGTTDRRLAEKLAEFYGRRLGRKVDILVVRGNMRDGWLH